MRKLLSIIFLLALSAPARAIDLSTLRDDCRLLIKDTGSTRRRFADAQLLRFLNEGQKDMVQRSRGLRRSTEFELVAGTTYYDAPSDFLKPVRVTRDYLVLPEQSIQSLDKNQEWQEVGGLPINYYVNFASRTKIGFYPFPDTTSSTGTIRMDYIASAPDLSADSDEPFGGDQELQPFAYMISLYCGYRGALIDRQLDMAQAYRAEYQAGLEWFMEDARARPFYRPSAVAGTGNRYR